MPKRLPPCRVEREATGPNGVTERFIAAVLLIEIFNRLKLGRASELSTVEEEVQELVIERHSSGIFSSFNLNLFLHKSIGLGQTKMSTLAMVLGWVPLIEHQRVSGRASREDEIGDA